MNIQKTLALGLCAVMAVSLVACGSDAGKTAGDGDDARISNPFTEYQTLEEAVRDAGFSISLPETIEGFENRVIRLDKENGLLEIIYENDGESVRFRKSSGEGDISGNSTEYPEKNDVDIDNITVTMKGDGGKVNIATWNKDGYACSIDCTTAVEKITMTDYIKTVNSDVEPIGGDPNTWGPGLTGQDGTVQLVNPLIPCDDMSEAAELAGFDMTVPNTPDGIQACENNMIQVFYGENGSDLLIRKAVGDKDISGDYNQYAQIETVDGVTLKGENDAFTLALWTKDGYTYSIWVGEALPETDMVALAASIR